MAPATIIIGPKAIALTTPAEKPHNAPRTIRSMLLDMDARRANPRTAATSRLGMLPTAAHTQPITRNKGIAVGV